MWIRRLLQLSGIGAALALAIWAIDGWTARRTVQPAAASPDSAELERLRQRVLALEAREVVRRTGPAGVLEGPRALTAPASEIAPAEDANATPQLSAKGGPPERRGAQYGEFLEYMFEQDGSAAPWSRTKEDELRDALSAYPDTTLHTLSCRSTLCRLEVGFATGEAAKVFADRLTLSSALANASSFVKTVRDEQGRSMGAVLLVAPEGQSLPLL